MIKTRIKGVVGKFISLKRGENSGKNGMCKKIYNCCIFTEISKG